MSRNAPRPARPSSALPSVLGGVLLVLLAVVPPAAANARATCQRGLERVDPIIGPFTVESSVWGDFDEDGRPDIAITWLYGHTATFLNRGNDVFDAVELSEYGSYPDLAGTADVNGDGHADLVYRSYSRAVVRFGDGHGNFDQGVESFNLSRPLKWVLVDVDGDGSPDFVDMDQWSMKVFRGRRDGTFTEAGGMDLGAMDWTRAKVVVGDFDGDGRLDIAGAATQSGYGRMTVSILWNQGELRFDQTWQGYSGSSGGFAASDVDGDGLPELVAEIGGELRCINTHDRGWTTATANPDQPYAFSGEAAADLDGDGLTDLVLVTGNAVVAVLWGTGPGEFGAPAFFGMPGAEGPLVVTDVDGDGTPDIVLGAHVLHGRRGSRRLDAPAVFRSPNGPDGAVLMGDLDGDGRDDIVMDAQSAIGPAIQVLWADGAGYRAGPVQDDVHNVAALADFDGDGWLDLAAVGPPRPEVLWGDGSGHFELEPQPIFSEELYTDSAVAVTLAGTRRAGLVAVKGYSGLSWELQLARFGRDRSVSVSTIAADIPAVRKVVAADIDGDGDSDLLELARGYGPILRITQSADGWEPPAPLPCTGDCNFSFRDFEDAAVADIDGDGRADIVAVVSGDTFMIFLQSVDGSFAASAWHPGPSGIRAVTITDFDNDGWPDLAVNADDCMFVARNTGGGVFERTSSTAAGGHILSVKDMDGDGWNDFVVSRGYTIAVLHNVCETPRIRAVVVPPAPEAGEPVTVVAHAVPIASYGPDRISILEGDALLDSGTPTFFSVIRWSAGPLSPGTYTYSIVMRDVYRKEYRIPLVFEVGSRTVRRRLERVH